MLQGHCTINNVTCLQSQQQLQLAPSCSVIVERCLEQQRFYLSPERNVYESEVLTDAGDQASFKVVLKAINEVRPIFS